MPTNSRADIFISLFVSAYENRSWADGLHTQPDKIDRTNPSVDWLATRKSDGCTLAIEHTIIEPFVGEKADFASFVKAAFLEIERDTSLLVPGRCIQVFVPVCTLEGQPKAARNVIVQFVHRWIKSNRLVLRDGRSEHRCAITGTSGNSPLDITLNLNVVSLHQGLAAKSGSLQVRRQPVKDDLDDVTEKALRRKLSKLVNTAADKHILVLEREHMNLHPKRMLHEIEKLRDSFPELARVDEIWIVETIGYGSAFFGTHLRFELYENGLTIGSFDFNDGKLMMRLEDGVSEVVESYWLPAPQR